jgi:hypothetical protein
MVSLNLFSKNSSCDTDTGRLVTQEVPDINPANVFEHAHRHLADYRNICQVYYVRAYEKRNSEIDTWANDLLKILWTATTARDPG